MIIPQYFEKLLSQKVVTFINVVNTYDDNNNNDNDNEKLTIYI